MPQRGDHATYREDGIEETVVIDEVLDGEYAVRFLDDDAVWVTGARTLSF
jgi:hypothetical protein